MNLTITTYNLKSFDGLLVTLSTASKIINLSVVYAPDAKLTTAAHNTFIEEFSPILLSEWCVLNDIYILGDFNYHVNNSNDTYACKFLELLDSCRLK